MNVSQRKRFFHPHNLILFSTIGFALIYYCWDLNSWKFASVGDDWPFYIVARLIVLEDFLLNPFSMRGVFGENTLLGSFYQAGFLRLFGDYHTVWRLSNIILIIPISLFFYAWVKKLFAKNIALLATILLQGSAFIANYLKIGYVNPLAFTLFIVSLYLGLRILEKPTIRLALLLGAVLGISFYIYLGPLFPLFLLPYLFFTYRTHGFKRIIITLFFIAVGYTILLFPALLQVEYWVPAARKTILGGEFQNNGQILLNVVRTFLLFYANFDYLHNHFIAGPYLDLITRILAFMGIIICCIRIKKRTYALLLLLYITVCIIIGATSPYIYTPTTRGIFLIPFGALFAGIMLSELKKSVHIVFIILLLLMVFSLNFYQSHVGVFKQTGYTGTALLIKELQEAKQNQQIKPHMLIISDQTQYFYRYKDIIRFAYGLQEIPLEVVKTSNLTCDQLPGKKILMFTEDKKAQLAFTKLQCVLKPEKPLFLTPGPHLQKL